MCTRKGAGEGGARRGGAERRMKAGGRAGALCGEAAGGGGVGTFGAGSRTFTGAGVRGVLYSAKGGRPTASSTCDFIILS